MAYKVTLTPVLVTVLVGAATGSSAANPALASSTRSFIVGSTITGLATGTGGSLVDSTVLNADGSVTVTTRANVATANLTMSIVVATPSGEQ